MAEVFLNRFHIVKPKNCISQSDLLSWIISSHQYAESQLKPIDQIDSHLIEKLFRRYSVNPSQISQRYLECDDIISKNFQENVIYRINSDQKSGSDITNRAHFFSHRAMSAFRQFYPLNENKERPDHIIHVTCTGYISPSAAQKMVVLKEWGHSTDITHAYHMGCYASMPAVRIAQGLVISESVQNSNYGVDIVHTEMCGLHMNPLAQTPEQMIVQTLFADGHIKYSASTKKEKPGKNLKILAQLEKIIPDSEQDMSWISTPWGMEMNLSRDVPSKIKMVIEDFSKKLCSKAKLNLNELENSIFAIHPGGPKIIDSVQEILTLKEQQITESRKILFERGNMSSATLPHVWSEILDHEYSVGTKVISFAFGPGLTLFGSVFEIC
ncbi:MAG: naringenin-chalcone synthase [Bdellovibrionaceae bacterium]|nr:naringenin-chalcone synthase [Pseudobdellovibrionaceae bacterium]